MRNTAWSIEFVIAEKLKMTALSEFDGLFDITKKLLRMQIKSNWLLIIEKLIEN